MNLNLNERTYQQILYYWNDKPSAGFPAFLRDVMRRNLIRSFIDRVVRVLQKSGNFNDEECCRHPDSGDSGDSFLMWAETEEGGRRRGVWLCDVIRESIPDRHERAKLVE